MDLRAVPLGHGPHKAGGMFSSTPFSNSPWPEVPQTVERQVQQAFPGSRAIPSSSLSGPSLGMNTSSVVCAAGGLVILGTIVYFALK